MEDPKRALMYLETVELFQQVKEQGCEKEKALQALVLDLYILWLVLKKALEAKGFT